MPANSRWDLIQGLKFKEIWSAVTGGGVAIGLQKGEKIKDRAKITLLCSYRKLLCHFLDRGTG
jgi:hypothetical protein